MINKTKHIIAEKEIVVNKKRTFITYVFKRSIMVLFFLIISIIGISLAFFNYTRIGSSNRLVVGNIFLHYNTSQTISLENAVPRDTYDDKTYIGFTIDGINDYQDSLWYAIDIIHGDVSSGKSEENRLRDDLLRFTLVRTIDNQEEVILSNMRYDNIQNKRLYVEKIPASTEEKITHNYKLYMWISDEIIVGNDSDADYSIEEWNNLFASIKIRVVGDFEEKESLKSIKVSFDADGGTISKDYKYYDINDMYGELPIAKKEGYAFEGWRASNNVKVHEKKELQFDVDHTLTAIWSVIKYQYPGEFVFDGTNYLDTGVSLFNEENLHRNFYLSFDIVKIDSTNNANGVFITSQETTGSKYGFMLSRNGSNSQIKMNSNGKTSYTRNNIYYGPQNIKIIRVNDIIYYSLNNGGFTKSGDYTGFNNFFSNTVILGVNSNFQNYFKGTLANIVIKIITSDDVELDDYLYSTDKFQYDESIEFNGNTAINTGVYLFNETNATRDFYLSFDIQSINWGNINQSTIMSSKDESGTPWPGFELRRYGKSNYLQSKATLANGKYHDVTNIPLSTQNIRFLRVNNILYYSLDNNPFVLHYDFTGFNLYFNVPVVFGNAYNVETQRYFKGTIANIVVKFISREEALMICDSTCN